jgi:hypothetical protein
VDAVVPEVDAEVPGVDAVVGERGFVPVACTPDNWSFYHEFREGHGNEERPSRPRLVTIALLPERDRAWERTTLEPGAGPRATKAFIRAFLRRFFERQNAGVDLDLESGTFRKGPFAWQGGF